MAAAARPQNPIVAALVDDLNGRLGDFGAVQRHLDLVRAGVAENAALQAEAAAQLAEARRRLAGAVVDAAARLAPPGSESKSVDEMIVLVMEDPEVVARAAACSEVLTLARRIQRNERLLVDALLFLIAARAVSFALNRAHLLPEVLLAVAAAYALAYVASWGAVVPGPASLLRISVLLLCFLLGVPVVGNLV